LLERERELQSLIVTAEGRRQLELLAHTYEAESGRHRPPRMSLITYLLVFERGKGLVRP
jgi:hypothetical protein